MTKYFIGYKQGNGEYVYVSSINDYSVSVTINYPNGIDFINEDNAKNVCDFLNDMDLEKTYIPLKVTTNVEEVTDNESITNE